MNNDIRVLGKLISREKLEKYTNGLYKNPSFRNKKNLNVVLIEEVSDLPEEFSNKKYGYCVAEYIDFKYASMGIEEIEQDLQGKYISFTPKTFKENADNNTYLVYNPKIETSFDLTSEKNIYTSAIFRFR